MLSIPKIPFKRLADAVMGLVHTAGETVVWRRQIVGKGVPKRDNPFGRDTKGGLNWPTETVTGKCYFDRRQDGTRVAFALFEPNPGDVLLSAAPIAHTPSEAESRVFDGRVGAAWRVTHVEHRETQGAFLYTELTLESVRDGRVGV